MGPDVSELYGLAILIGLIASGVYLIHSMTVTRSVAHVRLAALVSIVFMVLLMVYMSTG